MMFTIEIPDAVQCSDCRLLFSLYCLEVEPGKQRCPRSLHRHYSTLPMRALGIYHVMVDGLTNGRSSRV